MANTKITIKQSEEVLEQRRKKRRKQLLMMILMIVIGITVLAGTSYAVFTTVVKGTKEHTVVAGIFEIDFEEGSKVILDNTYPISDAEGMKTDAYTFKITNSGSVKAMYRVKLEEDTSNPSRKAPSSAIKVSYKQGDASYSTPQLVSNLESGSIIVTDQMLDPKESISYEIKMWVDEAAGNEVMGKEYKTKIVIEAVQAMEGQFGDTIPPVITLNGSNYEMIEQNATYQDPGVTSIIDNVDGTITNGALVRMEYYDGSTFQSVTAVDTSVTGVYYLYYTMGDSSGNIGLAVRTVNVYRKDATLPNLTLTGNSSITLAKGTAYTEPGYTATDDVDGTITDRVVVVGTPNTNVVGTTVIKYIAIDSSGNIISKTRQVIVQ